MNDTIRVSSELLPVRTNNRYSCEGVEDKEAYVHSSAPSIYSPSTDASLCAWWLEFNLSTLAVNRSG